MNYTRLCLQQNSPRQFFVVFADRSLGADILIDDNPRYAIECAEAGIRVLLFDYENSYPWCKTESVTRHPLVTKVHNWGEVEHRLVSRTFS